jgi:preprotein translocase subunit SecG
LELLPQLVGIAKVVNIPYVVVAKISPIFNPRFFVSTHALANFLAKSTFFHLSAFFADVLAAVLLYDENVADYHQKKNHRQG